MLRMQCAQPCVVQCAASSGKGDSKGYGVETGDGSLSNALPESYNGLSALPMMTTSDVIMPKS